MVLLLWGRQYRALREFKPSLCSGGFTGIEKFAKPENEIRYQNTQMAIHRQDKKYRIYMT
jgi:hypothetical protein